MTERSSSDQERDRAQPSSLCPIRQSVRYPSRTFWLGRRNTRILARAVLRTERFFPGRPAWFIPGHRLHTGRFRHCIPNRLPVWAPGSAGLAFDRRRRKCPNTWPRFDDIRHSSGNPCRNLRNNSTGRSKVPGLGPSRRSFPPGCEDPRPVPYGGIRGIFPSVGGCGREPTLIEDVAFPWTFFGRQNVCRADRCARLYRRLVTVTPGWKFPLNLNQR